GVSPFDGLRVDPADMRRACEIQARGHLLHLREGYLETRGRGDALAELMARSVPPLTVLIRSVARLDGGDGTAAGVMAEQVERTLGLEAGSLTRLLGVRAGQTLSSDDARRLFPAYLGAMERIVRYVDLW